MKQFFVILLMMLAALGNGGAQSIDRTLITPAGNFVETNQGSLSWSTGEIAVSHVEAGQNRLTQGFQQAEAIEEDSVVTTPQGFVPNAFTPNSDDFNEVFDPVFHLPQTIPIASADAELVILGRQGEVLFRARPYQPWDGRINGRVVPKGTYYYMLTAPGFKRKGPISVLTGD